MASSNFTGNQSNDGHQNIEENKLCQECKELIRSLPREKGWHTPYLYQLQGIWFPLKVIQALNTIQKHFQAKDSDVIVATLPKSGTTWLKALTFAIVHRQRFPSTENHPLLTSNSHQLVPFFEFSIYGDIHDQIPHLSNMTERRLFGTHIPFPSLAKSIKESNCKIIYICRNPFDNFVSSWMYTTNMKPESLPTLTLEDAFERYCNGIVPFGPFWNHMLSYWKESIARPEKVLFLKYEDLKEDVNCQVKRVAEFLGCPFTQEEECSGVVQNIIKLCSFAKMTELEVNKSGTSNFTDMSIKNKYFFRKGEIGDWAANWSQEVMNSIGKFFNHCLALSFNEKGNNCTRMAP
ncbi:Sulfotransferase domain [Sesbania bispinosa]|nr:Sulfotransferase domain [Sesbania bispinosa]